MERSPNGSLDGHVAIVTGGGRGIGRAIAEALAAEGAAVAVVARTQREIDEVAGTLADRGGRAVAIGADVTDAKAVQRAVRETSRRLGPITLLINNAGTPGPAGADWDIDPDEWWDCVEVSLRGAFLCNRAVLPGMIERGGGRIIHVASRTGIGPRPLITATSVAKSALIRLSEALAISAGSHGIKTFAIHPGAVPTRLLDSYGLDFPQRLLVGPERAAALCARLATGRYDALSGRFLTIDDDLDALVDRADEIAKNDLLTLRLKTD